MTTQKKHKQGFRCERARKSVNYQRKANILLCFRFKLKQRKKLKTVSSSKKGQDIAILDITISVIKPPTGEDLFCKKPENSVIQQQNNKNIFWSEIK